jgi:hypothetical protein
MLQGVEVPLVIVTEVVVVCIVMWVVSRRERQTASEARAGRRLDGWGLPDGGRVASVTNIIDWDQVFRRVQGGRLRRMRLVVGERISAPARRVWRHEN